MKDKILVAVLFITDDSDKKMFESMLNDKGIEIYQKTYVACDGMICVIVEYGRIEGE